MSAPATYAPDFPLYIAHAVQDTLIVSFETGESGCPTAPLRTPCLFTEGIWQRRHPSRHSTPFSNLSHASSDGQQPVYMYMWDGEQDYWAHVWTIHIQHEVCHPAKHVYRPLTRPSSGSAHSVRGACQPSSSSDNRLPEEHSKSRGEAMGSLIYYNFVFSKISINANTGYLKVFDHFSQYFLYIY